MPIPRPSLCRDFFPHLVLVSWRDGTPTSVGPQFDVGLSKTLIPPHASGFEIKAFFPDGQEANFRAMKASALQKQVYESHTHSVGFLREPLRVGKVREWFSRFPPGRVLDVGCGDGSVMKPLIERHEIHGVDISSGAVAKANAAGIKAKLHDLEEPLPFADGFFDAVFCGETIEHQVDTDWLLSEINRVLKVEGQLVLTYPNIRTPVGIFMLVFLDMPPMYSARYRAPHYRDFTFRTIKIALRNNGFEVVKAAGGAFHVPGIGECCETLASLLPRFASTVILLAKKITNSSYQPENAVREIY